MNKNHLSQKSNYQLRTIGILSIIAILIVTITISPIILEVEAKPSKKCLSGMHTPGEDPCVPTHANNPSTVPAIKILKSK